MKKKLPKLKTDDDAISFLENADLSEYDLSAMKPVKFEFQSKSRSITMRLPESLFAAIKEEARRFGIPYQRYIRKTLAESIHPQS